MVIHPHTDTAIAVLGFAENPSDFAFVEAYQAGKRIAEHGATLVCGNNRATFLAAIAGACTNGGTTIEIVTSDLCVAAPVATFRWICSSRQEKHLRLIEAVDAAIIIGGGNHTLHLLNTIYDRGKPLIAVDGSGGVVERELPTSIPRTANSAEGIDLLIRQINQTHHRSSTIPV